MTEPRRLRATRYFKGHPEMIMFLVALPLFLGGLASLLIDQFRPDASIGETPGPSVSRPPAKPASIGPKPDEPLGPYIESRRAFLQSQSAKGVRGERLAVLSFEGYQKASELEVFFKNVRIRPVALQMRIPLPGFTPVTEVLGERTIPQAFETAFGPARVEQLREELKELEEIIPTVTDPEYREVYRADAAAHRNAITALRSDPALVFAVVVRGSYADLSKAAARPGVRLVDAAQGPEVSMDTHDFFGLLPEDIETSTFVRGSV